MFKKILAYALTVCLLISATLVPAYAVDEVYNIADDVLPAPVIYYTEDYYPGLLAQLRSSITFANNRIAHGSFATMNYNPSWVYKSGTAYPTGDFNSLTPYVTADQMDISGVYSIPRTTLLSGSMLIFYLPSTSDAYFDFQSSNIAFDQQDVNANTFYINGTLTFNLRNLWSFSGQNETTSFYLASDPLAVQLLIDGKAYGDIIDVTGYTSPFTSLYGNAIPANASVTFNNLKVYYQGDTPDMVGFRVYTGSSFTDGQYNYNNAGDFIGVDVTNTVTMRFTDLPDITFVQEGGDGYSGSLNGILSAIQNGFNSLVDFLKLPANYPFLGSSGTSVTQNEPFPLVKVISSGFRGLSSILSLVDVPHVSSNGLLNYDGGQKNIAKIVNDGFRGFRTYFTLTDVLTLGIDGQINGSGGVVSISTLINRGFQGLGTLSRNAQSYVADTVFPWQSYNMQTHQLNTATNITGQNNLFFTAFQSIEDKLGRLAYVFGSDEDLALKDSADPSTDAFRQDFAGGASLSDIKDSAELATSVPQLMDSGFNFADGIEEIGSNNGYLAWFTAETWAALDSTGNAALADSDYLSDYYDNLRRVEEKRHWGD